jgi:hypothetical protein
MTAAARYSAQTSLYAQRVFAAAPSDLNTFDELFDVEGPGTVLHEWVEAMARTTVIELGRKYRLRVRRGWFRESVAFDHAAPIGPASEAGFDYPYPIGPRAYFATAHAEFYNRH